MAKDSLKDRLRRFPPFLCFAVTTIYEHGRARHIGAKEIARRSGLTFGEVQHISNQIDWSGVTVAQMLAFLDACGIDLCHLDRVIQRIKARKRLQNPLYYLTHKQLQAFVRRSERHRELVKHG
jgi:hypothetical protein